MMEYISQNLWLFWTVIMFICLILELSSGDFYVTCFAIGALISIPVAVMDAPFWLQVVGLGGMFRTQYPVDSSTSGKGYP